MVATSRRHGMSIGEPKFLRNQSQFSRLAPTWFNKEILMTSQNQNPGQQNQNPGQKPGQQQGGGQKPGQQQQDPGRQGQNPGQPGKGER
jgi:hypothetical protein